MKSIASILLLLLLCASCNKEVVAKPDKLLTEDQMVDILYDLSLLEGMRSSDPESIRTRGINTNTYIYKKYKIDSLQLAQNERYYAADVDAFAKVYERVGKRIENNKVIADSLAKKAPARNTTPQSLQPDTAASAKPRPFMKRRNVELNK